jgi:drug/metabolite transporter (DMT)-like permease
MIAGTSFRLRQVLAFAAVYLIWGSTYLAIRFAIETLPGFTMAAARFLAAGVVFLAWALLRGAERPTLSQFRSAALVGTLLLAGGNGAVVWAEHHVASGLVALIVAIEPLWVAILFWLTTRDGRSWARTAAGVALGFSGAVLLVAPSGLNGGAIHLPAALVVVLGSLSWAGGSVFARHADLPKSMPLSVAVQMLTGGTVLALAGLGAGEWSRLALETVSARSVVALLYLLVFGTFVAFSAYSWLVRTTAPTLVATYAFVNPLVAVALGWLFAGEAVGLRTFVAAGLIVSSVALVSREPAGGPPPRLHPRRNPATVRSVLSRFART